MTPNQRRIIVNTHLQELALLLLAGQPIKDKIQAAADISRGRILADLNQDERELYLAGRDVLLELARQLGRCQNLEMLAKTLKVVQGITTGQVVEYAAVQNQILDETPGN